MNEEPLIEVDEVAREATSLSARRPMPKAIPDSPDSLQNPVIPVNSRPIDGPMTFLGFRGKMGNSQKPLSRSIH